MSKKPGRTASEARERLDAEELIALIKRVNPTDRNLPTAERERRYREKSELQSALIRRFADELRVEADPLQPNLVLLRHLPSGSTCGHAVTSELDDAAASWVRMQLDLGEDDESGPESERGRATHRPADYEGEEPESLLRQGAAALEEYHVWPASPRARLHAGLSRMSTDFGESGVHGRR